MLHVETVDLSARGVTLPADRVGMVVAQTTSQDVPAEAVGGLVEALRRELDVAGIVIDPEETELATVRAWRARCEQQLAMGESTLARLSALMQEITTVPLRVTELEQLDLQLAQTEVERKANDAELASWEKQHRQAQTTLSET